MTLTGSLTGFFIIALVTLHNANVEAETKTNSLKEPIVPFPPMFPTAESLSDICHHGQGRPRYPNSFFPRHGSSHFRRRGKAINRLESWFTVCCSGQVAQQSTQSLCCAQQAWKQALSQFCMEEYATMTRAYSCCEQQEDARWTCFDSKPSKTNYSAIPGYTAPTVPVKAEFTFNPDAC